MSTFEQIRQWVQSPTTPSSETPDQEQAEQTEQARKELDQLLDQLMNLPYASDTALASESTQESLQTSKPDNSCESAKSTEDICG